MGRAYRVSDLVSLKVAEEGRKCYRALKLQVAGCKPRIDPGTRLKILKHNLAVLARPRETEFSEDQEEFVNDYGNFFGGAISGRVPGSGWSVVRNKNELLGDGVPLGEMLEEVFSFSDELAENRHELREEPAEVSIEKDVDSVRFGEKLVGRKDIESRFPEDNVVITDGKVKDYVSDWDRYQVGIYTLMTQPSEDLPVEGRVETWPSCEVETVEPGRYVKDIEEGLAKLRKIRKTSLNELPAGDRYCDKCWYLESCMGETE